MVGKITMMNGALPQNEGQIPHGKVDQHLANAQAHVGKIDELNKEVGNIAKQALNKVEEVKPEAKLPLKTRIKNGFKSIFYFFFFCLKRKDGNNPSIKEVWKKKSSRVLEDKKIGQ